MLGKDASLLSLFIFDYRRHGVTMSVGSISSVSTASAIDLTLLAAANQEQGALLSLVSAISSGSSFDTYAKA